MVRRYLDHLAKSLFIHGVLGVTCEGAPTIGVNEKGGGLLFGGWFEEEQAKKRSANTTQQRLTEHGGFGFFHWVNPMTEDSRGPGPYNSEVKSSTRLVPLNAVTEGSGGAQ